MIPVGETPLRRKWPLTPVVLPGESQGQRSLEGCQPWGWGESDMAERLNHQKHQGTEQLTPPEQLVVQQLRGRGAPVPSTVHTRL